MSKTVEKGGPDWERVFGAELRAGDVIETWFSGGRDQIVSLAPYTGPIEFTGGAQMATFALNRVGMTVENGALFNRATLSKAEG